MNTEPLAGGHGDRLRRAVKLPRGTWQHRIALALAEDPPLWRWTPRQLAHRLPAIPRSNLGRALSGLAYSGLIAHTGPGRYHTAWPWPTIELYGDWQKHGSTAFVDGTAPDVPANPWGTGPPPTPADWLVAFEEPAVRRGLPLREQVPTGEELLDTLTLRGWTTADRGAVAQADGHQGSVVVLHLEHTAVGALRHAHGLLPATIYWAGTSPWESVAVQLAGPVCCPAHRTKPVRFYRFDALGIAAMMAGLHEVEHHVVVAGRTPSCSASALLPVDITRGSWRHRIMLEMAGGVPPRGWTAQEIASSIPPLHKASLSTLLRSLVGDGLLTKDASGRFRPAPTMPPVRMREPGARTPSPGFADGTPATDLCPRPPDPEDYETRSPV